MTATIARRYRGRQRVKDRFISIFICVFALVWIFPIVWTLWSSLRPYKEIRANGVFSVPESIGLGNYSTAIERMDLPTYLWNSLIITAPAVFLTLFFGSVTAFVVSRYSFRWNVSMLLLFTAGNLLPPQLVFIPVFKAYLTVGDWLGNRRLFYDSQWGVVLIHVAFQMGFATFVLSSYMKTIPKEISEAAKVDGASVFRHYWNVMLPLLRPGLTAGAGLVFLTAMKELPATLLLAPTGFGTLSTRVWNATNEGFLGRSAGPALALVALSSVPMAFLLARNELRAAHRSQADSKAAEAVPSQPTVTA